MADTHAYKAEFDHISGPSLGREVHLYEGTYEAYVLPSRRFRIAPAGAADIAGSELVARLHPHADTWEIEPRGEHSVWVNGSQVRSHVLKSGDVVEFGDKGPLSRYCQGPEIDHAPSRLSDIVLDSVSYLRTSRKPALRKISIAIKNLLGRLVSQTSRLFRIGVLLALAVFGYLGWQQHTINKMLQEDLARERQNLEAFERSLETTREQALTANDLERLRSEIDLSAQRLEALEKLGSSVRSAIAGATPSVMFLQGAFSFRDAKTGKLLRHVVSASGALVVGPDRKPLLTLEGDGRPFEQRYTGTGFVVGENGYIVTNRHVAVPWEGESSTAAYAKRGLKPELARFQAFLSGQATAYKVELVKASDAGDVAILQFVGARPDVPGLELAEKTPAPGDHVTVLGYPTGLRAMLAQAGKAFVSQLRESGDMNFWKAAQRLADAGHIKPLASHGIIAKITEATVVYDADTTRGGSGGPVLNNQGRVVAVNAAILPEYGGSNIGVPLSLLKKMLVEIEPLANEGSNGAQ